MERVHCRFDGMSRFVDPVALVAYDRSGALCQGRLVPKPYGWASPSGNCEYLAVNLTDLLPKPATLLPQKGGGQPAQVGTGAVENPKTAQGLKKHGLRLCPTVALLHLNAALADGVAKYGAANWREKGVPASIYVDAALRHIAQWYDGGEDVASDSKVKHLGHAMACLAIILDAEAAGKLSDDRPTPMVGLEELLKKGTQV